MSELTDFIRMLSEKDTKTLSQKALKVCEESGELAKVILPFDNACGTVHRFVDRNNILEEVVDTYLSSISVAYSLGFTDEEINDMVLEKSKKWARLQLRESKVDDNIPYEIHITVDYATRDIFIEKCNDLGVKPIILALQNGEVVNDVMTSSVHFGNNRSAYEEMQRISYGLNDAGYDIIREKIETVPWHPATPREGDNGVMPKDCYFETHIGVVLPSEKEGERLAKIAKSLSCHMSKNAFKVYENGYFTQMLTYRNYDCTMEAFESEANIIYDMICSSDFEVENRITEFSIYDTKVSHDSKWLEG